MAGPYSIPPRPADPGGELARSAWERSVELREIGGAAGLRAIRRRLAAVRSLKVAACGRGLLPEELEPHAPRSDPKPYRGRRERGRL